MTLIPRITHLNNYQFLQQIAEKENIPGYAEGIDSMLILDYIINNEDRHFRNFGFIRNVETLKFVGMAPLFDNGASLWYKNLDQQIGVKREVKPFNSDAEKQIKYIGGRGHLHWDNLSRDDFRAAFQVLKQNPLVSEERIESLADVAYRRMGYLKGVC